MAKKNIAHKVLIYPSESVFALGGNPFSSSVLASIRAYKHIKTSQRKGFIVLVKDLMSAQKFTHITDCEYQKIKASCSEKRPLTLVVKAKANIPKKLCDYNKIAIRIVEDVYLKELVSIFPYPLISTSLNPPKKQSTKSITKARVFAQRQNLDVFFIKPSKFSSNKTSLIYDTLNKQWLR